MINPEVKSAVNEAVEVHPAPKPEDYYGTDPDYYSDAMIALGLQIRYLLAQILVQLRQRVSGEFTVDDGL